MLIDVNLILLLHTKNDLVIVLFYFLTLPVKFLNFNKNLDTAGNKFLLKFYITMTNSKGGKKMSNNIFNPQQNVPMNSGYLPYSYQATLASQMHPEITPYIMPQPVAPAFLKGRPVSSLEEARAAQIDLDGSLFVFPDLGNKKIYTKKINLDGTATLNSYSLDVALSQKEEVQDTSKYVTKEEFQNLKTTLDEILAKFNKPIEKPTLNF